MNEHKTENNLFQRINAVRKAIGYVQKDKSVSTGGGSYRAVTHDMVTAMTRQHMIDNGIVSYPVLVESMMLPPAEGAKQSRYEATYDFHFVNADMPSDEITLRIQAHGMDNADKAPGKALSYAKKYAVVKLFEIETGEDEESRVQSEFPIQDYIVSINASTTMEELKESFTTAYEAAGRDAEAQKQLIRVKNAKKESLSKAEKP